MDKAFTNVFKKQVANSEIITIPTICKLKIKPETEISIQVKKEISNKHGYARYDEVPEDKLQDINKEIREIIGLRVKRLKKPQHFVKTFTFSSKTLDK